MVSTIVTAAFVPGGGGGAGESVVGIIPAKAVPERTTARAVAIRKRFMLFSLVFEDVRLLASKIE